MQFGDACRDVATALGIEYDQAFFDKYCDRDTATMKGVKCPFCNKETIAFFVQDRDRHGGKYFILQCNNDNCILNYRSPDAIALDKMVLEFWFGVPGFPTVNRLVTYSQCFRHFLQCQSCFFPQFSQSCGESAGVGVGIGRFSGRIHG